MCIVCCVQSLALAVPGALCDVWGKGHCRYTLRSVNRPTRPTSPAMLAQLLDLYEQRLYVSGVRGWEGGGRGTQEVPSNPTPIVLYSDLVIKIKINVFWFCFFQHPRQEAGRF